MRIGWALRLFPHDGDGRRVSRAAGFYGVILRANARFCPFMPYLSPIAGVDPISPATHHPVDIG